MVRRSPLELLPPDLPDGGAGLLAARRAHLAKRIRMRMIELGMRSQRELQRRTKLARGTLDRVLQGRSSTTATYERVAEALETTMAELLADAPIAPADLVLTPELLRIVLAYRNADTSVRQKVHRDLFGVGAELEAVADELVEAAKRDEPTESSPKRRSKRRAG